MKDTSKEITKIPRIVRSGSTIKKHIEIIKESRDLIAQGKFQTWEEFVSSK